ncbi:hypothetical protein T4C_12894 [Trichinella pseudospiralis]|uniref:Uncharacterized protein n=1 Tax=Trichinella pseudospiralis TaxID=6337 RepID=A0A0V1GQU6_TRIPS|nr:hypothetical protein T4C_12894 [Trichinella pseudospiralis]
MPYAPENCVRVSSTLVKLFVMTDAIILQQQRML